MSTTRHGGSARDAGAGHRDPCLRRLPRRGRGRAATAAAAGRGGGRRQFGRCDDQAGGRRFRLGRARRHGRARRRRSAAAARPILRRSGGDRGGDAGDSGRRSSTRRFRCGSIGSRPRRRRLRRRTWRPRSCGPLRPRPLRGERRGCWVWPPAATGPPTRGLRAGASSLASAPPTGRWRLRVAAVGVGHHSVDLPPGQASWWRAFLVVGAEVDVARGRRWAAVLGAGPVAGVASISGSGFAVDHQTRSLDAGGEASARVEWRPGRLRPWLGASVGGLGAPPIPRFARERLPGPSCPASSPWSRWGRISSGDVKPSGGGRQSTVGEVDGPMSPIAARGAQQAGDPAGPSTAPTFGAVYAEHAATVARWAARLAGPSADVEDITQEVFVVVSRRLPEFRGQSRMSTWLFGITAKVAANERRRRKLRQWWFRLVPGAGEDAPAAWRRLPRGAGETRAPRALPPRPRSVERASPPRARPVRARGALGRRGGRAPGARPGNVRVLLHRARAAFLKSMVACELEKELR